MTSGTAVLRAIVVAGALSAIVAGLAQPSAAQSCKQWAVPDAFWGTQSNGWAVRFVLSQQGSALRGSAEAALRYQRQFIKNRGSADGSITHNWFQVNAYWHNSDAIGIYQGGINPQGRIDGTSYDRRTPSSRATWHSDVLMTCAR